MTPRFDVDLSVPNRLAFSRHCSAANSATVHGSGRLPLPGVIHCRPRLHTQGACVETGLHASSVVNLL